MKISDFVEFKKYLALKNIKWETAFNWLFHIITGLILNNY